MYKAELTSSRVKELVSAQSIEEGAQERVRNNTSHKATHMDAHRNSKRTKAEREESIRLTGSSAQYQEAKDQQIPVSQRHRSEIQEKPQTLATWHNEGTGTRTTKLAHHGRIADSVTEGGEGGQARDGITAPKDGEDDERHNLAFRERRQHGTLA